MGVARNAAGGVVADVAQVGPELVAHHQPVGVERAGVADRADAAAHDPVPALGSSKRLMLDVGQQGIDRGAALGGQAYGRRQAAGVGDAHHTARRVSHASDVTCTVIGVGHSRHQWRRVLVQGRVHGLGAAEHAPLCVVGKLGAAFGEGSGSQAANAVAEPRTGLVVGPLVGLCALT